MIEKQSIGNYNSRVFSQRVFLEKKSLTITGTSFFVRQQFSRSGHFLQKY